MFEVNVFQGNREFFKVLRLGVVIVHTNVTVSVKTAKMCFKDDYNWGLTFIVLAIIIVIHLLK